MSMAAGQIALVPAGAAAGRVRELSPPRAVSVGAEYFELATLDHFWVRRRFEVLRRLCGRRLERAVRCAEIGCGQGVLQVQLEAAYGLSVDGFDLHRGALERNRSRRGRLYYYDIQERRSDLQGRYDLLLLFDVLEHVEEEAGFMDACRFHLRAGGALVLNVPARPELFSSYDVANGHFRRYTRRRLKALATRSGMRLAEHTYWGLPLYPLAVARKLLVGRRTGAQALRAGFCPPTTACNTLLRWLARLEPLPQRWLGTSLLAVLEDDGG